MEAMEAWRLELYDLLKPKLDEEPARKLVLALGPAPEELVTKKYLDLRLETLEHNLVDRLTWRMITVMGAWSVIVTGALATAFTALK